MNKKITLLLIIALLSVSTSPIIGRALTGVGAISISFWRMFIAAIALWIFSFIKPQGKMKLNANINKTIYAGILLGIHFALFFEAVKITKIANATFLGTLAPFFTLLVELFILKRYYNNSAKVKELMKLGKQGISTLGKKIKGRKRHILVDHLGLLIAAVISSGNCGDRDGLEALLYFNSGKYPNKIF